MKKSTFNIELTSNQNTISIEDLRKKLDSNEVPFLLDIRCIEEYEQGTINHAIQSEWDGVADLIREDTLPRDKEIIVFCYNGHSSRQVTMVLKVQGYQALSLTGGYEGWEEYKKNHPTDENQ